MDQRERLRDAVGWLSVSARRAMLGAAKTQPLQQGTWQGCAFNAAGRQLRLTVASGSAAAAAFGMTLRAVMMFIHVWDTLALPPDRATRLLVECLEDVGDEPVTALPKPGRGPFGESLDRFIVLSEHSIDPDDTFTLGPSAFTLTDDIDDHERIARALLFDRQPDAKPLPRARARRHAEVGEARALAR